MTRPASRARLAALTLAVVFATTARAECPPDCVAGGGPATTDCFVQFSGITGSTLTCTDGTACDADGAVNGACRFPAQVCLVRASASCTATPLDGPAAITPPGEVATALAAALAGIDPVAGGCTAPGIDVALKVALAGIKPGKLKLGLAATAGGRRDKDKLRLKCMPNAAGPTLSGDVQPILTARCAVPSCHSGPAPSQGQNLAAGNSYANSVNVASTIPGIRVTRVKPGSIKASFMARKILGGKAIPRGGGAQMPSGCPLNPQSSGCLTDSELFTILAWIKAGAPDN